MNYSELVSTDAIATHEGMGRGRHQVQGKEISRDKVPGERQRPEKLTAKKMRQGIEKKESQLDLNQG